MVPQPAEACRHIGIREARVAAGEDETVTVGVGDVPYVEQAA